MTVSPPQATTDGFTIVVRDDEPCTIHLLRPYESCNTDDAKEKIKVEGSREVVLVKLGELGYTTAVSCKRCFPYEDEEDT